MNLLYNVLKVDYKEVNPKERGFHIKNEASRIHVEQIGTTFLNGYHTSLKNYNDHDKISYASEQEDSYYKGFFYEGVGMGLILADFFTLKKASNFQRFLSVNESHKYILNIGVGWAFARLPFLSIGNRMKKFDPLLRWLILDGYGFHQAYFNKSKYVDRKVAPKLSENGRNAFYQGVGRCLWFICGLDVELISKTILTFPMKFHNDLWAGIGLASTYAGKISKQELIALKKLSKNSQPSFQQGCSFAVGARNLSGLATSYTEQAAQVLTGLGVNQLSQINDLALNDVDPNVESYLQNIQWKEGIKGRIKKHKLNYEKIG